MKNKAFTLVETLAVIILLGVILSIAIPSINNAVESTNKRRIKEDAEMLIILAKEYVETHKEFKEGSISICNDTISDECIDPNKLSDVYDTKKIKVEVSECEYDNNKYSCKYAITLENNKYTAEITKEGVISVTKK